MVDTENEQEPEVLDESNLPRVQLSHPEHAVLRLFRRYLMTPGKMLCLSTADLEAFHAPLAQLTDRGLLVAETFRGGYSLTETGFAAMREDE
jgi:hypothetical protein